MECGRHAPEWGGLLDEESGGLLAGLHPSHRPRLGPGDLQRPRADFGGPGGAGSDDDAGAYRTAGRHLLEAELGVRDRRLGVVRYGQIGGPALLGQLHRRYARAERRLGWDVDQGRAVLLGQGVPEGLPELGSVPVFQLQRGDPGRPGAVPPRLLAQVGAGLPPGLRGRRRLHIWPSGLLAATDSGACTAPSAHDSIHDDDAADYATGISAPSFSGALA
mmetsp:Transcript_102651/g.257310  ORF Transcript_102651/g.257310 Transcript_102651/m.257310 type:complete len:219 (+) Transcript_102651:421-1077(+)